MFLKACSNMSGDVPSCEFSWLAPNGDADPARQPLNVTMKRLRRQRGSRVCFGATGCWGPKMRSDRPAMSRLTLSRLRSSDGTGSKRSGCLGRFAMSAFNTRPTG